MDGNSDGGRGEVLDIKIADLKATAPHFHTHSTDLAKALTKLQTALAAAGSPWGTDEQGRAFNKAYGPHVKQIEHAADVLSQGLASIREAMVDMADGHIDNEELIRSMFSRLRTPAESDGTGRSK